jgi:hypothetical protein
MAEIPAIVVARCGGDGRIILKTAVESARQVASSLIFLGYAFANYSGGSSPRR